MKYKAFTLVELIVVITILGILSTVAFVSYVGYSENSRDSARISNLTKLEKSLEARKAKAGEYPTPDNASDVTYLGKKIFTQGILGDKTKKHLKFKAEGMDPKYEADYTYSVTADGKRYEMGTIMEDGSNNTLGFLSSAYANEDDVALNHGNFNGKYYSTKINGETHVFTLPSLTLKNKSNFEVRVDQSTDNFAVTGIGALPETYSGKSEANESVSFTPRLLYRGPNCGVESDQEIVNFVATLRDSFNTEPFISDPTYASVFSDYDHLRENIDDFEALEELGIKINEALGCHIKNFKTTDIFPTQCGYEGLNFESVVDGFDIATQSCLFEYTGDQGAVVRDGLGVGGSQGLDFNMNGNYRSGRLKYRAFTYVPTQFMFQYNANISNSGYIAFYVDGVRYQYLDRYSDGLGTFQNFTTPLLKPGIHEFEWRIYTSSGNDSIVLDNLSFPCQGGGGSCGWEDMTLDSGHVNPWDLFTFYTAKNGLTGSAAWALDPVNKTQGNHSITNLDPTNYGHTRLTRTFNFTEPRKFSFDINTQLTNSANISFYINGKRYNYYNSSSSSNSGFETFTTPLLPAGNHEFQWSMYTSGGYGKIWLDNFQFSCVGGGTGCGWSDMSLDAGDIDPSSQYTFYMNKNSIVSNTPWLLDSSNKSEGTHSITSPDPTNYGHTRLTRTFNFTEPRKFSFDINTQLTNSANVSFYINGKRYNYYNSSSSSNSGFETFTTELLPAGSHEFQWSMYTSGGYGKIWLDNFQFTCVGGGTGCGWSDMSLDAGDIDPSSQYTFYMNKNSIVSNTPWLLDSSNKSEGTHSITNPDPTTYGHTRLTRTFNFTEPRKFSFDINTQLTNSANISFYINGKRYNYYNSSSSSNSGFETFTTPLLPVGDHEFSWQMYTSGGYGKIWLDNFQFTCVGGGTGCGWSDMSLDAGNIDPSSQYTFYLNKNGVESSTPWILDSSNKSEGTHSITNPDSTTYVTTRISRSINFTEPRKFSFDINTDLTSAANISFYINGIRYNYYNSSSSSNSGFETFTTPLLPAGNHEFRWQMYSSGGRGKMWLDNFQFSCIGGGSGCGWTDMSLDEGSTNPSSLFTFYATKNGSVSNTPWLLDSSNKTEGTHSITNPDTTTYTTTHLTKTVNFSTSGTFSFDINTDFTSGARLRFYVDGSEYTTFTSSSSANNGFVTYTTHNLSAGNHTLSWQIYSSGGRGKVWLDNFRIN